MLGEQANDLKLLVGIISLHSLIQTRPDLIINDFSFSMLQTRKKDLIYYGCIIEQI